eukprot:PhM_4_TR11045/c0_g1_i1/m.87628
MDHSMNSNASSADSTTSSLDEETKDYLAQTNLRGVFNGVINDLVQKQPADPYLHLAAYFAETIDNDNVKTQIMKEIARIEAGDITSDEDEDDDERPNHNNFVGADDNFEDYNDPNYIHTDGHNNEEHGEQDDGGDFEDCDEEEEEEEEEEYFEEIDDD